MIALERPLNIGLRFATLGTRFLFVFFLARYLDAASIGYYGIFTATIGYCLYVVGLDYYVFVTREVLRIGKDQCGRMLKGQMALALSIYALLVPVAILLLGHSNWPGHLVWWFLPILLFEHFNQEVFRLLVALSEQISASVILFVRQGSWAIAIILLMAWQDSSRDLDAVMALWTLAGAAAALIGVWKVRRLGLGGWRQPIDWRWIRQGVTVSSAFLLATLALRGIQTIDRYWLEALGGIELVGAYVLFAGVASALMVFLDAGVFSFTYPALIQHHHRQEHAEAKRRIRRMLFETLAICAGFAILSREVLPWLLRWVGNPLYVETLWLYGWVLAAAVLNAIAMVPHYVLYARGQDRVIIASHVIALPVFLLSAGLIAPVRPLLAVPAGVVIAFLFILLWKAFACWRTARASS